MVEISSKRPSCIDLGFVIPRGIWQDAAVFGIGDVVRRLRKQKGLTLEQLNEATGIDKNTISDLERGVTKNPHQPTLERLASALGSSIPDLYARLDRYRAAGDIAETTEDAEADTPQPSGSLAEPERMTQPDRTGRYLPPFNQKERAVMNSSRGRAIVALMAEFTESELRELLNAASAIDERRDKHHASKEGLTGP
jgi:transcriptional regulator with XRE-family HTH domain